MKDVPPVRYRFHPFCLDPQDRRITRGTDVVHLEPKSFDVLRYLVENAGHLVQKQELVDQVWSPAVVSDNSITRCIHQVRAALGDDAERPQFIETVPGSGYCFIASVEVDPTSRGSTPKSSVLRGRWSRVALYAIVIALVVGIAFFVTRENRQADIPTIDRIAILPFKNLTGDPEQEYFVQGVHEALVAELSRAVTIDVISRTSVMGFRDSSLDVPSIGTRLNVDAVIEGSVLRAGDKLTVTAQLIAVNPERHLWAERYHRDVSELFEITTEIVSAIASEVAIELAPEQELPSARLVAVDPKAYDAYLLGRFYFEQRSPQGYKRAREYFRQSIELDPSFAPAYAGLAHTIGSAAIFGAIKPADGFPEARRLAERAIQLDGQLAEGHRILAGVEFYFDWNWHEAERRLQRVLSLNANSAHAYRLLAEVYSVTGRHTEALAAVEKARAIDPLPPTSQIKPSLILYLSRDFEESIARSRAGLKHYPNFWQGHWLLCISLAALSRFDEAGSSCERAVELSNRTPMALGALGYARALAGRREDAADIAMELETRSVSSYVGPATIAMIYGALGEIDEAFYHLERAYELRDQQLVHAENVAFLDPLRSDPRFMQLRRKSLPTLEPSGRFNGK